MWPVARDGSRQEVCGVPEHGEPTARIHDPSSAMPLLTTSVSPASTLGLGTPRHVALAARSVPA
jgi:hypothetical protein